MRRFYLGGLIALVALTVLAGVCDAARRGKRARVSHRLPIHKTSLVIMPFDYEMTPPGEAVAGIPPAAPIAPAETKPADVATPPPPPIGEMKPSEPTPGARAVVDAAALEEQRAKDMGLGVAVGLRDALVGSDQYSIFIFSDKLASIRRAVELDSLLKKSEIKPPFSEDKDRVLKIARMLATDLVMTGSVDTLSVDAAKKTGRATLSAQLIDVKTGRLVKAFVMVQGTVPTQSIAANEDDLRALAVASAVQELKAQFLGEEAALTIN